MTEKYKGSKKLRRLWNKNPCCYWCGRLTRIVHPDEKPRHPPDMATREHLYTRNDMRRHDPAIQQPVVIACYECNHNRGSGEGWTYWDGETVSAWLGKSGT